MKRLTKYLIGFSVAGLFIGNPMRLSATDDAATRTVGQPMIAATEYCYAGSIVDPTTGEEVDLYNLCTDDLDLA